MCCVYSLGLFVFLPLSYTLALRSREDDSGSTAGILRVEELLATVVLYLYRWCRIIVSHRLLILVPCSSLGPLPSLLDRTISLCIWV